MPTENINQWNYFANGEEISNNRAKLFPPRAEEEIKISNDLNSTREKSASISVQWLRELCVHFFMICGASFGSGTDESLSVAYQHVILH